MVAIYNLYRLLLSGRERPLIIQINLCVYLNVRKSFSLLILSLYYSWPPSSLILAVQVSCGWKGWIVNKSLKPNHVDGLERLESEKCKGKARFKYFRFLYRPECNALFTLKSE